MGFLKPGQFIGRVFSRLLPSMMRIMEAFDIDYFRSLVIAAFPELRTSRFELATAGWDSLAVDVDDRLIFKFPRHAAAEKGLLREARLLAAIRPKVSMPVPDLRIESGPPLFSCHEKLKGAHLVSSQYDRLGDPARQRLGEALGRFYAEFHGLDRETMTAAGARSVEPWQTPAAIRQRALPLLKDGVRERAAVQIAAFEALAPDPHGVTYGFFDGHGWNMAFDHSGERLNGIYDFADSGFAPLHQEFIYSNFISPDLTERVISTYEALTARAIDRQRVAILTGVHRLSELAQLADMPQHAPDIVRSIETWDPMAKLRSPP